MSTAWSRNSGLRSAASALLFVAAVVAAVFAGRAFLPEFNEGALTISAVTLPGTPIQNSDQLGRVMEDIVLAQPEVASTARRTGRAELDQAEAAGFGDVGLAAGTGLDAAAAPAAEVSP